MPNFLFLMADEHRKDALSCLGSPAQTPHIDNLARRGTLFSNAYTPSPICVPTRAALATGEPVHVSGHWDSAKPYAGEPRSWMHTLRDAGVPVTSIGKLHFRSAEDDNGWSEEILPMHVVGGLGWAEAILRDELPDFRDSAAELAAQVGEGESSYTDYDLQIAAAAEDWLAEQNRSDTPWALSVSFVSPHYPLTCPEKFLSLYDPASLSPPLTADGHSMHPVLKAIRDFFCYDDFFGPTQRQQAIAAYYGLCSFVDHQVGRVLAALERSGMADDTVIVFTSDHGEMLGDRGFWTKQTHYESSAGVPMVMAGPGVPVGKRCNTAVSLLDVRPTALAVCGVEDDGKQRSGVDLQVLARAEYDPDRCAFAEYHDGGSPTGFYMLRWQHWKYVHYVGAAPQLFDLQADPHESVDLSDSAEHVDKLSEGERRLRLICDPEAVNHAAFADQQQRLQAHGGREQLLTSFRFNHTPTPSEQAALEQSD